MIQNHFNLIVGLGRSPNLLKETSGDDGWMLLDRMPDGYNDFRVLSEMPALIMPEVEYQHLTPARVTCISNIRSRNYGIEKGIAFDYNHITDILHAEDIIPERLNSLPYGGHRTLWYVEKGNLINMVMKTFEAKMRADKPTFFGLKDWPLPKLGHVGVMMPYSSDFDSVYQTIDSACMRAGCEPIRVKDVLSTQPIIADVFSTIVQASVVICDITGLNPNVLYEAGLAHARNVPVVLISQDTGPPPFNLSQTQVHRYTNNSNGLKELHDNLIDSIRHFTN